MGSLTTARCACVRAHAPIPRPHTSIPQPTPTTHLRRPCAPRRGLRMAPTRDGGSRSRWVWVRSRRSGARVRRVRTTTSPILPPPTPARNEQQRTEMRLRVDLQAIARCFSLR